MRGLDRLARWLGLGSRSSFDSTPLSQMDQADKLLRRSSQVPPRSRPCLSPSRRGLVFSLLFVAVSLTLTVMMWCTQIYDQSILKLVSIRNDLDMIFDLWRFPPTRPFLNIYIFNYTNYQTVHLYNLPRVEELGPYVFQEKTEKINITFNDNGTVSFQESKSINFIPEKSVGSLDDTIVVPNIPILSLINKLKHLDYVTQVSMSGLLLPFLGVEPFQKVSVNDFVWGYEDKFYYLARQVESLLKGKESVKFGFLAKRRGVSDHVITVDTGSYNLDNVANVELFDGEDRIGKWDNTRCDIIEGHEGGLFPGNMIYRQKPQQLYLHDMCRKFPLIYNKTTVSEDGFPVNKYVFPDNMFDYSYKENACYKYKGEFPPKGTFFSGACKEDAPIYSTLPHFLNADNILQKSIQGLKPDPAKHSSYFLIHEKLGVTLRAQMKFQLNVRYHKANFVSQYKGIEDGTILPIAWLHYDSGPLPEHFVNIVYHLTYTTRTVQIILQWLFLITFIASVIFMYRQIKRNHILFRF